MSEKAQKMAARLEREGQKVLAFFKQIEPQQWDVQVYSDGSAWTIHHLLAHLLESEISIPKLIRGILAGGLGVREDFDINRYNESKVPKLFDKAPEELLDEYAQQRAESVTLVRQLSDTDLETRGRHPFLGETQISEMVKLMYLHHQLHVRDIRKVIKET